MCQSAGGIALLGSRWIPGCFRRFAATSTWQLVSGLQGNGW
eukprot:COSAG03_NODE_26232_length_260_cov_0.956522_1_plen_40_part_10